MSLSTENQAMTTTNSTTTTTSAPVTNTTTPTNSTVPISNYVQVAGKRRKLRKSGKVSRWGPLPERNRWGDRKPKDAIPSELNDVLNSNLDAVGTELNLLRIQLQECGSRLANPVQYMMSIPENERSPSPAPIYDNKGVRLNTRELRVKRRLTSDRDNILTRILQLNPDFTPPSDWKRPRFEKKIYVPVLEYPDCNFFGLIIGPRGQTQKMLQKETGTKIAIRGKGSFVEGKANRVPQCDDNEPMHVLITGPDEPSVEKAGELIAKKLIPVTETENEHKAKQLRLMATQQSAIVTQARCRICGGAGHPVYRCPDRSGDFWTLANVQCAICGELSHVTADCKLARGWSSKKIREKSATGTVQTIEMEYDNFMKELHDNSKVGPLGPAKAVGALTNVSNPQPIRNAAPRPPPQSVPRGPPPKTQNNYKNNNNHNNNHNHNNKNFNNNNNNKKPPAQPNYNVPPTGYQPQQNNYGNNNYGPPPWQRQNQPPQRPQQNQWMQGGGYNQPPPTWQQQQNQNRGGYGAPPPMYQNNQQHPPPYQNRPPPPQQNQPMRPPPPQQNKNMPTKQYNNVPQIN